MSISYEGGLKLRHILLLWSKALLEDTRRHGIPNSFGCTELAKEYGLVRRDGYRLGTTRIRELELWLRELLDGAGLYLNQVVTITYTNARFHLKVEGT